MIAALKSTRFQLEHKLRAEYGVPSYILDAQETESALTLMIEKIPENPWFFYNKEIGFTIQLCDRLAEKFNAKNQLEKCKAYMQWSLDKVAEQGHCYGREWQINSHLRDKGFTDFEKQKAIQHLVAADILFVSKSNNYFLSKYFNAERSFATILQLLNQTNGCRTQFNKRHSYLYENLNETQRSVVDAIEYNSLIVLTGLPGTGKTTTVQAIVDCYGECNVVLLAPTGKAASRMSELCKTDASTLHSYFFNQFGNIRVVENKIVIVDELSMCDAEIIGNLATGLGEGCVLLVVGDPDQLPSVGPGQVLKDVLASNIGLRYHLNQIMRQKPGSIIKSAHSIHAGGNLITDNDREVVTFFPKNWDLEKLTSQIVAHPEWRDAQLLSVLKEKGSTIINRVAQGILNPDTSSGYRVGDKVIHTKNNKDLGVYNGEMGVVVATNYRNIIVKFKDKVVEYPHALQWQLDFAYCITVHKSQGSEFEKVVFFLNPSQITTRNLLYTGLTRAKKKIMIVAPSEEAVINAIANIQKPRQTSLKHLIKRGN